MDKGREEGMDEGREEGMKGGRAGVCVCVRICVCIFPVTRDAVLLGRKHTKLSKEPGPEVSC